jgi:hypothetical protein
MMPLLSSMQQSQSGLDFSCGIKTFWRTAFSESPRHSNDSQISSVIARQWAVARSRAGRAIARSGRADAGDPVNDDRPANTWELPRSDL